MLPVFLGLMLAAALAWIFLSNRLFAELRKGYPELYEALGSPNLFMRRSLAANFKVFRFLFKKNFMALENKAVNSLCRGLLSIFYIYLVCLGGCILLLLDKLG